MIRRGPRPADRFTMVANRALEDPRLSFRARGLLAYLLSRPAGWTTTTHALAALSPLEGRDAIRTALRDLEALGYLQRRAARAPGGTWDGYDLLIVDEPAAVDTGASGVDGAVGEPVDGAVDAGENPGDGTPTGDGLSGAGSAVPNNKKDLDQEGSRSPNQTRHPGARARPGRFGLGTEPGDGR